MLLLVSLAPLTLHAQTTAQLTGSVTDNTGAIVPGAKVTLINDGTKDARDVVTNQDGVYSFPALLPATYTLKVTAKGFSAKDVTGIELHGGDQRTVPALALAAGSESQTITVEATGDLLPIDSGQREAVLTAKDIDNLALQGRDTTELLKVLPGATTTTNGIGNNTNFSDINISANQSAIGGGININGVPNRGGTALLSDGVNVLDPGDMAGSLGIISPEMTQEVSVQASNFGAYQQSGPVVVSAISKSGTSTYHGEGYFDVRNDVLNANDWLDNNEHNPKGGAHYYYPGGNVGGPVPFTHKKVFFWGGYERFLQNLGSSSHLTSFIPSPEMLAGDFTNDNADNMALCPASANNPTGFSSTINGTWCNNINGMILPDGTTVTNGHIPSQFLDPGAKALAAFWPKANQAPSASCSGCNYFEPIANNNNNGWVYRLRVDYNLSEKDKFFISYQQAYSAQLAQGNGAHIYWTPGNSIPAPGGGLFGKVYTKNVAGHFVHVFNPTTTNEFIAAWGYGNFPFAPPNPSAADKSTLGYTYKTVFNTSALIPSYSSAGNQTFPDFSQGDWFEPAGSYIVRKEVPSFTDNLTKVWGKHTVKFGAYTQNTGNLQGNDGVQPNGNITSFSGQNPNIITGNLVGAPSNPLANFVIGNVTGYQESNGAPVSDMAYQNTAVYADDSWRASNRLTLEIGARFEHVGHWYDRQGTGMAVFYPNRVFSDYASGKIDPGYYWHSIDAGVPISGQPNRLMLVSPRIGVSYDLGGDGKTVVRGGWGVYRFTGQYNDYAAALTTAQAVKNYNLPGQKSVLLSQIGSLSVPTCTTPPCGVSGSQNGLDPTDYGVPKTEAYNLTIDRRLKFGMLLDVAYVGNSTTQIDNNSETIEGGNYAALADKNKAPVGSFFAADPRTGIVSTNPQNLGTNLDGSKTGNQAADYHPYGYAYGTASVYESQSTAYTNYNALQVAVLKQTGKLTYNFNFTWSKTLGTGLQIDPFNIRNDYGVEAIDRPYVFNSSYTYQIGHFHRDNRLVDGTLGGWVISGISTWQAGGNLQALNSPNFGLSLAYDPNTLPGANGTTNPGGVNNSIGAPTYFGTDAGLSIMPTLTCNPQGSGYTRVKVGCFGVPAYRTQGGQAYPYMSLGAYFDNDLALYKSFPVHREQNVQFRISAFNWLNHPLPSFSSASQLTLHYNVDYTSKAATLITGTQNGQTSPTFGFMDSKTSAPQQRIVELNVKYNF